MAELYPTLQQATSCHAKLQIMNWLTIALVVLMSSAVILLIILRNRMDKKDLVKKLNNDFPKTGDHTNDIETDELTRNVH